MASTTVYENLYQNLKNRFTVGNDNCECTLGEYMLSKAKEAANVTALPVAVADYGTGRRALMSLVSYVNDKLSIKKAPVKDKTMRAFPLRTAFSSLMSALLVCTLVVTYGLAGGSELASGDEAANAALEIQESYETDSYSEDAESCSVAQTENY